MRENSLQEIYQEFNNNTDIERDATHTNGRSQIDVVLAILEISNWFQWSNYYQS